MLSLCFSETVSHSSASHLVEFVVLMFPPYFSAQTLVAMKRTPKLCLFLITKDMFCLYLCPSLYPDSLSISRPRKTGLIIISCAISLVVYFHSDHVFKYGHPLLKTAIWLQV